MKVLLSSLKISSGANQKKKEKNVGAGNIEKGIEPEFTIIYCRSCVSMIENRILAYLYNERFGESNEEKCTVFQSMAWSLIVHKNTIKNCSLSIFLPVSFFVSFISLFIKVRIILQFLSRACSIVYMFPHFFTCS